MNEPADPRLVALGLVPPAATEQRAQEQPAPRPAPPAPKATPRVTTPTRAPGPLDRFLPPSYTAAPAPPVEETPAPSRPAGPLDGFLAARPAPAARPALAPRPVAPPAPVAQPPRPVAPFVPAARPPAPPPVPLAMARSEPLREPAAPPPLPPLASAIPSEAAMTLAAGAVAAASAATLPVKVRTEKPPKAQKAPKLPKPPKAAKLPRLSRAERAAAAAAATAAIPVIPVAPAFPASAVLLRGPIAMGLAERRQQLTLEHLGMRIDSRLPIEVAWTDVEKIRTRRGRVVVHAGKRQIVFGVPVEGVIEPALAGPLARVVEEAKTGSLDLAGSAFLDLQNATDSLRDRFTDEDDPIIPAIVGLVFLLSGAAVVALLPEAIVLSTRSSVAPGQFLIDSRLSSLDPRMLIAGFASGAILAAGVIRAAMGHTGQVWARGTLRGWDAERFGRIGRLARRALARIVLGPSIAAGILLVAFVLALPSAREETIIDQTGFRLNKQLPFFDETRSWKDVTDVTTLPAPLNRHPEGFAVTISFAKSSPVTTNDHDLRGGTDRQLFQRATTWRAEAP